MIRHRIETVATSKADDAAFRALADVAALGLSLAFADSARHSFVVAKSGVPADRLTALIRKLVAIPAPRP